MKKWKAYDELEERFGCIDGFKSSFISRVVLSYFLSLVVAVVVPFLSTALVIFVIVTYPFNLLYETFCLIFNKWTRKRVIANIEKNLLEYEAKLLKDDWYYVLRDDFNQTFINPEEQSLSNFIHNFLANYNREYYTYDILGNFICERGCRRSLGDIFLICRIYYPRCTIIDVLKILINLLESRHIASSWCNTIYKYVFHTQNKNINYNGDVEFNSKIKFQDLVDLYKQK